MASIRKALSQSGKVRYYVEVRLKDYPNMRSTFDTEDEAKAWALATEDSLRNNTKQEVRLTLSMWIERYIEEVLPHSTSKTQETDRRTFLFWKEHFGNRIANDITGEEIEIVSFLLYKIRSRKKGGEFLSPETRRKYVLVLNKLFKVAMQEWKWATYNPVICVSRQTDLINLRRGKNINNATEDILFEDFKKTLSKLMLKQIEENKYTKAHILKCLSMGKSQMQKVLQTDYNSTLQSLFKMCNFLNINLIPVVKEI